MKSSSLIVVLFMGLFGSFIGFDRDNTTGNLNASPPMVLPELPKYTAPDPLSLSVNLETGQLDVDNATNGKVNVTIEQKVIEKPKYITKCKTIKEEVYVEDKIKANKLMNKLVPLEQPKLILPKGTDREE